MVRAGGGSVVEIGGAASLEGSTLALGRAGVGWRQVGVVVGAAQRHGGGDRGGVGKGGGVVHPGTGESTLCQGEAGKLALKLTWERTQVRRTCRHTHTHTHEYVREREKCIFHTDINVYFSTRAQLSRRLSDEQPFLKDVCLNLCNIKLLVIIMGVDCVTLFRLLSMLP